MYTGGTVEWWISRNCALTVDLILTKMGLFYWGYQFLQSPPVSSSASVSWGEQNGKVTGKRAFKISRNLLVFIIAAHCYSLLHLPLS